MLNQPGPSLQVQQERDAVHKRLEMFTGYFVKEFETKLQIYHMLLEGEVKKAGKLSDAFQNEIAPLSGSGILEYLCMLLMSMPLASTAAAAGTSTARNLANTSLGNFAEKSYKKKAIRLADLVYLCHEEKASIRKILVEASYDLFQSFEMQFMGVTKDSRYELAMRKLAEDATNRAVNYFNNEKDFSITKEASLITKAVILGKSKIKSLLNRTPGFKIKYKSKDWHTASLFEKVGLVVEEENEAIIYYKKEGSRTGKYGYRRLLTSESWESLKEEYNQSDTTKSTEFIGYQYVLSSQDPEKKLKSILEKINLYDKDLEEDRVKQAIKEVKDEILKAVSILEKRSNRYHEDNQVLKSIEDNLKSLNVNKYFEDFTRHFEEAKEERKEIKESIQQGFSITSKQHDENIIHQEKTHGILEDIRQKILGKPEIAEVYGKGNIYGLGITKYYYISRTFNRQITIKIECLRADISDLFVISNIERGELSKLVLQEEKILEFKDKDLDESKPIRFFILDSKKAERSFKQICEKYSNHNIHWLENEENSKLTWQCSKGSLSELRKFIDINQTERRKNVNKITDIKDRIVIISAGPGMGKSTLLSYLAEEQKKDSVNDLLKQIIRVDLNDYVDSLSRVNFDHLNEATNFLKGIEPELKLENAVLLLDGFDEISPSYEDKVIKLLGLLRETEVKKIWITSRSNIQNRLEDKLSIFSYNLEPFSEEDQKDFLKKFWGTNLTYALKLGKIRKLANKIQQSTESIEVKELIEKVLDVIGSRGEYKNLEKVKELAKNIESNNYSNKEEEAKKIISVIDEQHTISNEVKEKAESLKVDELKNIKNSTEGYAEKYAAKLIEKFSSAVSDKEREFTGVPLQTRMLAEAYEKDFTLYFCSSGEIETTLPDNLDLADLYERFIKTKYEIFFRDKQKSDLNNQAVQDLIKDIIKTDSESYGKLAIDVLFPKERLSSLDMSIDNEKLERLQRIGIFIKDGNRNIFIHRTFAEYFSASLLVSMLNKPSGYPEHEVVSKFLREQAFESSNKVIRNFFDRMLAKDEVGNKDKLRVAVLNNDKEELLSLLGKLNNIINNVDRTGRTVLHLAASHGYQEIVQALLKQTNIEYINQLDKALKWSALSYADKGSHWGIAELLLKHGANADDTFEAVTKDNSKERKALLHIAAKKGYAEFAKVLVDKGADFKSPDQFGRTPLHYAAEKGEWELVKYLVDKGADLNIKDKDGMTPLHWAAQQGQLELVKYLVDKGANIDAKNQADKAPIDLARERGNQEIVKFLEQKQPQTSLDEVKVDNQLEKSVSF